MERSSKRAARRVLPGALLLVAVLAAAPTVFAADHAVKIIGFGFTPNTVTVAVGDSVTWTNGDGVTHTATADDASFDTGQIGAGTTSTTITFSTAGTFAYHCSIHSSMHGTIVVSAASTPPPTDTLDPATPAPDHAPWALLALAGLGGLLIGRRRFGAAAGRPTRATPD
jgi:MYXO-CTERM domain-containing protein